MGAQYHPRQIRKTWLGAFRTDGRLKPVTSANRQIIIATTRVQNVGSRKRLEQREDISFFLIRLVGRSRSHSVPSGFLSADDTAPDQPYFFIYHRLSSAHRSFVVLTTTAKTLSVCRQMRERERERDREKK